MYCWHERWHNLCRMKPGKHRRIVTNALLRVVLVVQQQREHCLLLRFARINIGMANEQRVSSDGDAALIADASADLHQRVLAVLRQGTWWKQATAEQKRQYLTNADVLAALVKIIRDDWPAGAAFDESSAASGRICSKPGCAAEQLLTMCNNCETAVTQPEAALSIC
jgi:hypothetical protein